MISGNTVKMSRGLGILACAMFLIGGYELYSGEPLATLYRISAVSISALLFCLYEHARG